MPTRPPTLTQRIRARAGDTMRTERDATYAERRAADPMLARVNKLYHLARWTKVRRQVFEANPLCVECQREGRTATATDVDHVVPARVVVARDGDGAFFDLANLEGLCHPCHDRKSRRERRA